MLSSFYVLAWIASVLYGAEAILAKLISRHAIRDPWRFGFFWSLAMLICTIPIALYFGAGMPSAWTYILLGSVCYALANAFYIISLSKLDVSVFIPLFSFRTAMAVVAGALLLGEVMTGAQYFWLAAIFIFGFFVTVDERFSIRSFFNIGVAVAFLDMLMLVFLAICIQKSTVVNGFWDTTLWIALIGQVWSFGMIAFFKKGMPRTTARQYGATFLVAFVGAIGGLFANAAYAENLSISSAIIALPLSAIIAVLCSFIWPGLLEKHTLKVYLIRFTATAVMTYAALQL